MREEMRAHGRLAKLATRQHGVVSNAQLRRLGYSQSAIGRAASAERLHRLHRGVYAVGHRRLTKHGHCVAAVLACGRGAQLSHSAAAWLWGLARTYTVPIDVTVPRGGRNRPSICVHQARGLNAEDVAHRESIPVTSVSRTLLDLASTVSGSRLERAIERSEQLELFDLRAVDSLLARAIGHPGAGRLKRALSAYREPAFTRSVLEQRFLALVREAGLPPPSANVFVAGFELDMYWERQRFAVELDGYKHHRTRAAFERDRLRQEELKLAGIETIRLTARRVDREPETVVNRLATLLERRLRDLENQADRERRRPPNEPGAAPTRRRNP
jgi:hypothetical protein